MPLTMEPPTVNARYLPANLIDKASLQGRTWARCSGRCAFLRALMILCPMGHLRNRIDFMFRKAAMVAHAKERLMEKTLLKLRDIGHAEQAYSLHGRIISQVLAAMKVQSVRAMQWGPRMREEVLAP